MTDCVFYKLTVCRQLVYLNLSRKNWVSNKKALNNAVHDNDLNLFLPDHDLWLISLSWNKCFLKAISNLCSINPLSWGNKRELTFIPCRLMVIRSAVECQYAYLVSCSVATDWKMSDHWVPIINGKKLIKSSYGLLWNARNPTHRAGCVC